MTGLHEGGPARAHAAHRRAVARASAPLVGMGLDLLKAVALLNGGAASATILFIALILREERRMALALVGPLSCFGFGLAVAAFAIGWSYLAQENDAKALAAERLTEAPPFVEETAASREASARSARYRGLAFVAVLAAMASAVAGFLASAAILLLTLR